MEKIRILHKIIAAHVVSKLVNPIKRKLILKTCNDIEEHRHYRVPNAEASSITKIYGITASLKKRKFMKTMHVMQSMK